MNLASFAPLLVAGAALACASLTIAAHAAPAADAPPSVVPVHGVATATLDAVQQAR